MSGWRGARPRRLPPPCVAARASGAWASWKASPSAGREWRRNDTQTFDEPRLESDAALAGEVCQVTGAAQQALHLARPVFLLDVDEGLEFAQVMSIAQGVQHARDRVVGLPVVMHDGAIDRRFASSRASR